MRIIRYFFKAFVILIASMAITSCFTKKDLVYLQSKEYSDMYPTQVKNRRPEYKLQPNDILYVNIQNPDTETYSFFNTGNQESGPRGGNEAIFLLIGNPVDQEGNITIPLLGKIKVTNLTLVEATNLVQAEVDKYLRNSSVSLKLLSFKVSVLGEVRSPGYYYVYNAQCTILEALGLAGDMTQTANRGNVKLIRQTENGAEVILVDLRNPDLVNSKYYYLLPNDVLYVEPSDQQISRLNFQPVGIGLSALSAVVAVAALLFNITRP